jgi:hypothetical protein
VFLDEAPSIQISFFIRIDYHAGITASIDDGVVFGEAKLTRVSLKYRINPALGASPA